MSTAVEFVFVATLATLALTLFACVCMMVYVFVRDEVLGGKK